LTGWILALAGLAAAPSVAAEPGAGSRIAIVGPADAAVTMQLDAELQLLGFEVVRADAPQDADAQRLRALARELDVAATIVVDAHGTAMDLWVVDRVTGKTLIRSVALGDADSEDAARVAAVRAIDLLRYSFREIETDVPLPESEVAPSPVVRRVLRPARPTFAIAVAPAVAGSAGGLGATGHAAIAFEVRPHRVFGFQIRGLVPVVGARVEAEGGSARVHPGWIAAGPRFAFVRPDRVVQPSAGIAVGAAFVGMRGVAPPPFEGRRDHVVSALFEADVAIAIAVQRRLRIWCDAGIAVAVPRAGVRFVGRRVAAWGLPVGTGALGLQVVL
jgi:hypothetical protein